MMSLFHLIKTIGLLLFVLSSCLDNEDIEGTEDKGGDGPPPPVVFSYVHHRVRIALGELHSCILKDDGEVLCWGAGESGRLGNDASSDKDHPVAVVDGDGNTTHLSGIIEVSSGRYHSCALKNDGGVLCWGRGINSQLGNDSSYDKDHPVAVVDGDGSTTPLSGIIQISAGSIHNCALKNDGGVLCWGWGSYGRLGNNSSDLKDHPVVVVDGDESTAPFSEIIQVSLGNYHSCALKNDGRVFCWGGGNYGQLGHGGVDSTEYPVVVVDGEESTTPLSKVVQISAGGFHTCALRIDGGVLCWGYGKRGVLGNNKTDHKDHPVVVVDESDTPLSGIVQISSGGYHTCALKDDGGVLCWGDGGEYQLGNDASSDKKYAVEVIDGDESSNPLSGIVHIGLGYSHSCALKNDGGVLCWGTGENGRLGNDASDDKDHPVEVIDGDESDTSINIGTQMVGTYNCTNKGNSFACSLD